MTIVLLVHYKWLLGAFPPGTRIRLVVGKCQPCAATESNRMSLIVVCAKSYGSYGVGAHDERGTK